MSFTDSNELSPVGNFVILQRFKSEEKTQSGLVLPYQAQSVSLLANVVAVGPGRMDQSGVFFASTVKKGDTVLIDKIGGFEVELDGEKFVVVRETEIIAIVKEKK